MLSLYKAACANKVKIKTDFFFVSLLFYIVKSKQKLMQFIVYFVEHFIPDLLQILI